MGGTELVSTYELPGTDAIGVTVHASNCRVHAATVGESLAELRRRQVDGPNAPSVP